MVELLGDRDIDVFWIGGGGLEYEVKLRQIGVTVTGWLPQEEALAQLERLNIYVQTSRWEGPPIALLQARKIGPPAVVTDVVGDRSAVEHGGTGFVASGAGQIAGYMRRVVDDEAERKNFGGNARSRAAYRFSETRYHKRILTLYGLGASVETMVPLQTGP